MGMEEILDIVDENNNPTGKSAPRSQIHSEGLWHRTVHVYVFRKNNGQVEFLVHLRSPFKDLYPNCWDTRFGGHIKSGVSLEDGVREELQEEIGLDAGQYKLMEGYWKGRNEFPNREFSIKFYLEYNGDLDDLKFNDGEVQKVEWVAVSGILDSMNANPGKWADNPQELSEVWEWLEKKLGELRD